MGMPSRSMKLAKGRVMTTTDEAMVKQLLDELVDAWNRGDTGAYGARFLDDATFTNVNGMFHEGREQFDQRHEEIFRGPLKATTITLTPRKLRFIRQDIAILDTDCGVFGAVVQPPGVQTGAGGALRTSWWIAAYHNVWQATVRYETAQRESKT
jgi:uncharacterized protein (TIGR02246 family)